MFLSQDSKIPNIEPEQPSLRTNGDNAQAPDADEEDFGRALANEIAALKADARRLLLRRRQLISMSREQSRK